MEHDAWGTQCADYQLEEALEKSLKQHRERWRLYLVDKISHDPDINYSHGDIFIKEILKLFEVFSEPDRKAQCIEIAARIVADLADTGHFEEDRVHFLYGNYVQLIKNGYADVEKIMETLTLFLDLKIEPEEVIKNLTAVMDENKVVKVLSGITNPELWNCKKYEKLLERVSVHKKKCKRFDLVLHFCLLVNPIYYSNIEIVGDYLKKFYSYPITLADWIFSSDMPNESYVKEGIISKREQLIFIKTGDMLNKYKIDIGSELSLDEVLSKLCEASGEIHKELDVEMRKLYDDFLDKRDFLEAACSLPPEH